VVDALPQVGGQCAELYADKPIYDIPGIPICTGQELIDQLQTQIKPFAPQFHLQELVSELKATEDGQWHLQTDKGKQFKADGQPYIMIMPSCNTRGMPDKKSMEAAIEIAKEYGSMPGVTLYSVGATLPMQAFMDEKAAIVKSQLELAALKLIEREKELAALKLKAGLATMNEPLASIVAAAQPKKPTISDVIIEAFNEKPSNGTRILRQHLGKPSLEPQDVADFFVRNTAYSVIDISQSPKWLRSEERKAAAIKTGTKDPAPTPEFVAEFLTEKKALSKEKIGEYLGEQSDFNLEVLKLHAQKIIGPENDFLTALRNYSDSFVMPGEAQKIDRIMETFGKYYTENKAVSSVNGKDAAYSLAFSVMMLN
jgi:hypothetical protein